MDTRESKSVLELKRSIVVIQQNVNKIYNICSSLYQEIQDVKRFIDYKPNDSLGEVENTATSNISKPQSSQVQRNLDVLNNVEEFAETTMQGHRGRNMKIIDN